MAAFMEGRLHREDKIQTERPFLGERLWLMYWIYQSFAGRTVMKVIKGRERGLLQAWDKDWDGKDDSLIRDLHYVLPAEELQTIVSASPLDVPRRVISALETKILAEMNQIIFGSDLATLSVKEQQRLAELVIPPETTLKKLSS